MVISLVSDQPLAMIVLPDSELPVELVELPVDVAEHSETERLLWMASIWRHLYKDRSSRKTDSRSEKRHSGSHILLKIVSENQFSGKTYFYTIHPCVPM